MSEERVDDDRVAIAESLVEALRLYNGALADLSAERAVSDALRKALEGMVKAVDDLDAESGNRNLFVSSGCLICTLGTTPDHLNTGLCAYHTAVSALAAARGAK